jgi:hypothetical protein
LHCMRRWRGSKLGTVGRTSMHGNDREGEEEEAAAAGQQRIDLTRKSPQVCSAERSLAASSAVDSLLRSTIGRGSGMSAASIRLPGRCSSRCTNRLGGSSTRAARSFTGVGTVHDSTAIGACLLLPHTKMRSSSPSVFIVDLANFQWVK